MPGLLVPPLVAEEVEAGIRGRPLNAWALDDNHPPPGAFTGRVGPDLPRMSRDRAHSEILLAAPELGKPTFSEPKRILHGVSPSQPSGRARAGEVIETGGGAAWGGIDWMVE